MLIAVYSFASVLMILAGSAFTNGLTRLLPGPFKAPPAFSVPQFVPALLLMSWMIRIRLTPWVEMRARPAG